MNNPIRSIRTFSRPKNTDSSLTRLADYFGCNVFDIKAMSKRLASNDVEALSKVMRSGGKIDAGLSERIASAAKEWAVAKGATHYCHWFQPLTEATAEKHDAFLWFDKSGNPIEKFSGRELLQGEPDASSFPSGGLRSTFEARGYTGWDPSSPMFVMETENGVTLYIPSIFVSYNGEALDHKVPLLRANDSLSKAATKLLHLLGENEVNHVSTTIGSEQEFFLVDRQAAMKRPDLKLAGRTVFGRKPAKGQELEDHYFAHIPSCVHAFFNELELELYKLGVPLKTRHNEVAPAQFEVAPIFESSNIACDHNQLAMKVIRTVAMRHGFSALLHEKPFAGVNGSGKHLNWSMADSTGRNLLDPGQTPHQNIVFLTFLAATLQGIYDHADVLRASIASAGNDHRLGANEAPPAIVSCFLGITLNKILDAIESGETAHISAEKALLQLGLSSIQDLALDNTDRNRTSPFAFTGNKFEFRAVGSSTNVSGPAAVLNAAVCSGIQTVIAKIEAAKSGSAKISPEQILLVLKDVITQTKNIRFEGNGYSDEWKEEAAKRGLNNFPNTASALAILNQPQKTEFLARTNVLTQHDVLARLHIQQERYIKQRTIELQVALEMVSTGILPAALNYQLSLLDLAIKANTLNIPTPAKRKAEELGQIVAAIDTQYRSLQLSLEKIQNHEHQNLQEICNHFAENLMPKLEELRQLVDALEAMMPRDLWPYPTYTELLFGIE